MSGLFFLSKNVNWWQLTNSHSSLCKTGNITVRCRWHLCCTGQKRMQKAREKRLRCMERVESNAKIEGVKVERWDCARCRLQVGKLTLGWWRWLSSGERSWLGKLPGETETEKTVKTDKENQVQPIVSVAALMRRYCTNCSHEHHKQMKRRRPERPQEARECWYLTSASAGPT